MLKAVLFDFDGVIADSEFLHFKALQKAFARYNIDITKEIHYSRYLGYSDIDNIDAVSRDYNQNWTPEQVDDLFKTKTAYFEEMIESEALIISGVQDFVELLKANHIRRAVCSGATKRDIEQMLASTPLEHEFEVIVTADDVQQGKPDPEGYLLTLEKLNKNGSVSIQANQCLVIEDSKWGLQAAKQAGMKTVAVTNTYPADELVDSADIIVDNLAELSIQDIKKLF